MQPSTPIISLRMQPFTLRIKPKNAANHPQNAPNHSQKALCGYTRRETLGGWSTSLFGAQSHVNINTKYLCGHPRRVKGITARGSIVCKYQYKITLWIPSDGEVHHCSELNRMQIPIQSHLVDTLGGWSASLLGDQSHVNINTKWLCGYPQRVMKNVKENANRYSIQVLTIRGDSRVTNVLQNTLKNEQCLQAGADPPNPKKTQK